MDHRKVAERVIKDVGRDNIIAGPTVLLVCV